MPCWRYGVANEVAFTNEVTRVWPVTDSVYEGPFNYAQVHGCTEGGNETQNWGVKPDRIIIYNRNPYPCDFGFRFQLRRIINYLRGLYSIE